MNILPQNSYLIQKENAVQPYLIIINRKKE